MKRAQSFAATVVTFALVLGAAVLPSTAAHALPHFGVHRHPADANDTRVNMSICYRGNAFRDVKINGHVYTLLPDQPLAVTAPEGTPVYTNSTGAMHRKGDLLFAVSRTMDHKTIPIN